MGKFIRWLWEQYGTRVVIAGICLVVGLTIILVALGVSLPWGISMAPGAAQPPVLVIGIIVLVIGLVVGLSRLRARHERPSSPQHSPAVPPAVLVAGSCRARLESKLGRLRGFRGCPFVLAGSVYLDVILFPIGTTVLQREEWSDIGPVRFELGGSSLWVGRYLKRFYDEKSYFFSTMGRGTDPFTREFDKLIARERDDWLRNRLLTGGPNSRTAVTVHLVQGNSSFTTMFTHPGMLPGFGWGDIEEQLHKRLAGGGVLHISGYMKTGLWLGLQHNLQRLHHNVLICIDHGRLTPKLIGGNAVRALRNAFRAGLVDVYFCTYQELSEIFQLDHGGSPTPGEVEQTLEELAKSEKLPILTMVRDSNLPCETKAYAIVEKSVWPLAGAGGTSLISSPVGPVVGPINAFNAAMMYEMVRSPRFATLEELVIEAGNEALSRWAEAPHVLAG